MAEYIVEYLDEEETCKDCLHIKACDAWVRHGDYLYSVEGCPFHIPAADVEEVKHGRWIEQNISGEQAWCCSECKTLGSPHWKRCPVCEAKMDGWKENGEYIYQDELIAESCRVHIDAPRFKRLLMVDAAADVVEVVRCRDCRHYVDAHADGSMYCMRLIRAEDYCETGYIYPLEVPVTDHCFCSYGERRKENG